ncbi:MAG: helix-turn-helix domain-containing protein [Candidatus Eisenbacteria bacterium]|nr:helix-turn-helix domain-containing protein [Candidatus Eisenbacteria bacterium]
MKAELHITDTDDLVRAIAAQVVSEIKPFMAKLGMPDEDPIFSVKEVAKYLGVSSQWVYQRTCQKEIPFIKVGKFPRFKKSEIDHWLNTLKVPAIHRLSSGSGIIGRIRTRR